MMKRVCAIFLFMLMSLCSAWSQQSDARDSTAVIVGSQLHTGWILAHSRSIADLTKDNVWGFQADISRVRYSRAAWNACNCYSQNGVSLGYYNFNNPTELGKSVSLSVFAEPQLTYGNVFLSLRAGAGVAYLTRVYHPDTNPRNLFFSRPWSGILMTQLSGRYQLGRQWLMRLGLSYNHISNGGQRQPNKGMNFPVVSFGLGYVARHHTQPPRIRHYKSDKSLQYYAGLSYNTRAVDGSNTNTRDRKVVLGLQGGFYKPVSHMHALGLGVELSHDGSLKELARQTNKGYDHRVVSGLLRHHLLFGRFDFSQALGLYFHKEYPDPNKVFQRYAIEYRIFKKLQAGFSLKAHLHVAEQMDVRIGFVF